MWTYKAVSAGFSRAPVCDHHRLLDVAVHLEVVSQRLVCGVVRQAPHKKFCVGRVFLLHWLKKEKK